MKRVARIQFWSILSAAFIGPGTVTTASLAGAGFGMQLAWALLFSTIACIVLQEAVARLVIVTGRGLGAAIRSQAGGGRAGTFLAAVVGASIVLGCAAYEAGNLLGGVAGLRLLSPDLSEGAGRILTLLTGLAAGALLWSGRADRIARTLGFVVAVMGLAFLATALRLGIDWGPVLRGSFLPRVPAGAELLAVGLIGTTVVPYNLFLGAGLARGQQISEMRPGLIVAIALGGLISLAVMVVGSALAGEMSFDAVAAMLRERLGPGGGLLFGVGLFAAGFSSAVTAPMAAALTVNSLLPARESDPGLRSRAARATWIAVLLIGTGFGASGLEAVSVIVLAQALNGLVLPLVAVLVLLAVNDAGRLGAVDLNGVPANLLGVACVAVTVLVGSNGVTRAVSTALGRPAPGPAPALGLGLLVMLVVVVLVIHRRRRAT